MPSHVAIVIAGRLVKRLALPLPTAAIGFLVLALLIGVPWLAMSDVQGIGFRLRLLACVLMGPLAALLLHRASTFVGADARALLAVGIALGVAFTKPSTLKEGLSRTHPALVTSIRAIDGVLPPHSIVITQDRKVMFMIRWYADQPAQLRPPADLDPAKTYRLLVGGLMPQPDMPQLLDRLRAERPPGIVQPRDLHPWGVNDMVLVPEATYRWLVDHMNDKLRAYYDKWDTT
jgi:hypothetical protein